MPIGIAAAAVAVEERHPGSYNQQLAQVSGELTPRTVEEEPLTLSPSRTVPLHLQRLHHENCDRAEVATDILPHNGPVPASGTDRYARVAFSRGELRTRFVAFKKRA